VTFKSKGF
jgi:dynein regulatory complex protein 1